MDHRAYFQSIFQGLNENQRSAVEQIEGPVLVVAGPGTGKTHILAARIGKILLETDTSPDSILCLTFTDAGVQAMRQRLLTFIGPDAHRVHIYTFHSFCNRVIQENQEYFGYQGLEPLSDLERVELIRKILNDLPINHPLRIGKSNPYFYEKHLKHLFQSMKREKWTAVRIEDGVSEYLQSLPGRKEFIYQVSRGDRKKGDLKQVQIEDAQQRMEKLLAGANLFGVYQKTMQKVGRYDYEDMILWVNQMFADNEVLLRRYQEKYLYILVDEFQDTNGAQNKLIQQLVNYWDNPNLFIVGDDDQSIYEFQGARLKNITDYYYQYQAYITIVVLNQNYRSTQSILDGAGRLIRHNEQRIIHTLGRQGLKKNLIAANRNLKDLKTAPIIKEYPNRHQELIGIVKDLKEAFDRGESLNEIGIIYARHRQAEELITLLERMSIPFNTRRAINILNIPFIRQVRQLLQFIAMELEHPGKGEFLIYKILHFQFLNIERSTIEQLSWNLSKSRQPWREALKNESLFKELRISGGDQLLYFAEKLDEWIKYAANNPVMLFVAHLINSSGLLKWLVGQPEKNNYIQILHTFILFVQQENNRSPRLTVNRLLDIFAQLDENQLGIPFNKVSASEDGVNLLTAHSSKGLEFRKVYLLDITKDFWEPKNRSGSFQFRFPDTLTFASSFNELESRRRLFYVGVTRAQEQLIMSYSRANEKNKPLERSLFLDEFLQDSNLEVVECSLPEDQLLDYQLIRMGRPKKPLLVSDEKYLIDSLLENFSLSASSFNAFLRCPLSFYFEYVLRIPSFASEAASYGTAIHNALEQFFHKVSLSPNRRNPAKTTLVRFFTVEMKRLRSHFSKIGWHRYLEQGQLHLGLFYDQNANDWHKKVRVELPIRDITWAGIPLKGTIDKLELYPQNKVRIVDYKTGSHDAAKMRPPSKSNPYGGSYWRQLYFYKILYDNYNRNGHHVEEASIVYIDPNSKGQFIEKKLTPNAQGVQKVQMLIKESYQAIQQHQFYEGCGKDNCTWCNFVKAERGSSIIHSMDNTDDKI